MQQTASKLQLKIFQKSRIILGFIGGLSLSFLIFQTSRAQNPLQWVGQALGSLLGIGEIASSAVYQLCYWIATVIAWVASLFITLEAKLLSLVIDNMVFTRMPVVQTGWAVARDFANILFVFILVYIAFAYILRVQTRQVKGLLVKMIVMAILINFSLMIGGVIIDFTNIFFRYFIFGGMGLSPATGDGLKVSIGLANALRLNSLVLQMKIPEANASQQQWEAWVQSQMLAEGEKNWFVGIGKLIFTIVFSFLMIIIFGALVVILFVRLFWLWILLILAPLAWVIGLIEIPGTPSGLAKQWWQKFLQWSFVAPVMAFFIYLALVTARNVEHLVIGDPMPGLASSVMYSIQSVMQMFLVAGFIVAGLIAGQKMGAKFAGKALGFVQKTGSKVGGAIKAKAALAGMRAANAGAKKVEEAQSKSSVARALLGITGLGMASRAITKRTTEMEAAEWEKRLKRYQNLSNDDLQRMKDSPLIPKERAAIYSILAKRGGIKTDQDANKALSVLQKYDRESYKKILDERPHLDPEIQKAWKPEVPVSDLATMIAVKHKDLDLTKIKLPEPKDDSDLYNKALRQALVSAAAKSAEDGRSFAKQLIKTNAGNLNRLKEDADTVLSDVYTDPDSVITKSFLATLKHHPLIAGSDILKKYEKPKLEERMILTE